MYICDWGRTPPEDYEFCGCGRATGTTANAQIQASESTRQGNNSGGVQAGRDVTAHQIIIGNESSDPYTYRMEISRSSQKRSILPDNWVAAAAGFCTVASFVMMLTSNLKTVGSGYFALLGLSGAVGLSVLASSLYLRFGLKPGDSIMKPFGNPRSVYEKLEDGSVCTARFVAACPWCTSNGQTGNMVPRTRNNSNHWVCRRNPVQHTLGFDPVTIGLGCSIAASVDGLGHSQPA